MLDKLTKAFSLLRQDFNALKGDVQRLEKVRPIVKHGKDGVSPDANEIINAVLEKIPTPKDGVSPDINDIAAEAAKLIPEPKPGRDAIAPTVRDVADVVLANIEKPKDGVSPDVNVVAQEAAKLIPKPKDGVSPTPEAVAEKIPPPAPGKPGKDGKDGVSVTDVQLKNNDLFVFLDGVRKKAGRIEIPKQKLAFNPSTGGGGRKERPRAVTGKIVYVEELRAVSDADQNPIGTDNPLTVTFGPAQGTPSDPIQVGADGVISVNQDGLYQVRFSAQYGRSGSSGTSWLYFRTMIAFDGVNFVQVGRTVLVKLSNANEDLSTQNLSTIELQAGWKTKVELMRGSEGNNSGGLIATVPAEGTWTTSYSAEATIQRVTWEQT